MKHKARESGPYALLGCGKCLLMRGDDRVDQLRDDTLLGRRQGFDLFQLLPDLLLLKVTLRLSAGDHLHLDTLDLYQARGRATVVKADPPLEISATVK